jgi:hypothetical protein
MFSLLRRGLVYKDIDPNIVEHDEDIDGVEWSYEGRDVYRGRIDPRYEQYNLDVYWLYDNDINKIGLVEYEKNDTERFQVLWFLGNPFATLLHDERWVSLNKTVWSVMSYESYLDCLEDDFSTVFDRCLSSKYRLVTPSMLITPPTLYSCKNCKKQSIKPLKCHEKYVDKKNYFQYDSFLFVDESFIIYELTARPPSASSEQERSELVQEQPQQELKDDLSHPLQSQQPESPHPPPPPQP